MRRSFSCLAKPLGTGGGWFYAAACALLMALLVISFNVLGREGSLSGSFSYLAGAQAILLPLLVRGAFRQAGEGAARAGEALSYLIAFGLSLVPLASMVWTVQGAADNWAALAGYAATGAALLTGCLLSVRLFGRGKRLRALLAAFLYMALMEALPQAAYLLGKGAFGARAARFALYFLPAARLNSFLNGSLSLGGIALCAAIALFNLYLIAGAGARRVFKGLAAFALAAALLAAQPASVYEIDLTPGGVMTASEGMALMLKGLNLPVTIYQVAPVGEEDVWEALYLKKLAERHSQITYRLIAPSENAGMAALELEANALVVEQEETWVAVDYASLYQTRLSGEGAAVTFELEGALLGALDEATGLTLMDIWTPPGVPLNRTLDIPEAERFGVSLKLVLWSLGLACAGAACALIRRRHCSHEKP